MAETSQEELGDENHPELISDVEKSFYTLQNNLTRDAKNIIWSFLNLAKSRYPDSTRKQEWNALLKNLQGIILDFDNDLGEISEVKLQGLQRNAHELRKAEEKETASDEEE
ncbi:MAG: hypothetical protein ACM3KM_04005 [Acidobacteriaceae bacterium]